MTANENRKVKQLWWINNEGDQSIKSSPERPMILHNEFHGEYEIEWVCCYDSFGKEIERHNAKYIASIIWEEAQ